LAIEYLNYRQGVVCEELSLRCPSELIANARKLRVLSGKVCLRYEGDNRHARGDTTFKPLIYEGGDVGSYVGTGCASLARVAKEHRAAG
jgi:hypothetical protein